jgi:deoxycytidylate deaminase
VQVGAVIVGTNKVVIGCGYNGFPRCVHLEAAVHDRPVTQHCPAQTTCTHVGADCRGCSDAVLPWAKKSGWRLSGADANTDSQGSEEGNPLGTKYPFV